MDEILYESKFRNKKHLLNTEDFTVMPKWFTFVESCCFIVHFCASKQRYKTKFPHEKAAKYRNLNFHKH